MKHLEVLHRAGESLEGRDLPSHCKARVSQAQHLIKRYTARTAPKIAFTLASGIGAKYIIVFKTPKEMLKNSDHPLPQSLVPSQSVLATNS